MTRWYLAIIAILVPSAAAAGEPTALFSSDEPIAISISAPWNSVSKASPDDEAIAGVVTIGDEQLPVAINTRGKSRREKHVCTFPPLKIEFTQKPPDGSLFHKQKKLKLVTYCKSSTRHQQIVLAEAAAYRLYNVTTPESFRTRLAAISYVNSKSQKVDIERVGFFIEDVDDVAKRSDLEEVERGRTPLSMYDQNAAARAALFQYMIGNLDWDMTAGPEGEHCCHNGKIIGPAKTAEANLIPAPYDFDMSGLVDAPYALPPDQFRIKSVRNRVYRGFCAHNAETREAAADFLSHRNAFNQAVAGVPGFSDASINKATRYLDGFFDEIATEAGIEKNLIRKCRG